MKILSCVCVLVEALFPRLGDLLVTPSMPGTETQEETREDKLSPPTALSLQSNGLGTLCKGFNKDECGGWEGGPHSLNKVGWGNSRRESEGR